MFNPKGQSLIDEQLAISGLEMHWGFAAIGAATSIVGGIMGSRSASKANKRNKKAEKEQRKHQEKIAKLTNKHNDKLDAADKANYYAMREYSHDTNIRNWEHGKRIQDFQYASALKQYQKSQSIGNAQLGLNADAQALGFQAEQDAIKEAFIQTEFQQKNNKAALKQAYFEGNIARKESNIELLGIKSAQKFGRESVQNSIEQLMTRNALDKETAMVESLTAEGTTQLRQAGKSKAKAQQANKALLHRSLMALSSELSGTYKQAAVQLAELDTETSLAEIGVGLNLQRIDNAIKDAEAEAEFNLEVMKANMKSSIKESERNLKQIALERSVADLNTRAGMMLKPDRMPYEPMPEMPPERVFVERMEAIPGFVPPAQQQSTWAPLISGIGGAASSLASANFKADFLGRTQ